MIVSIGFQLILNPIRDWNVLDDSLDGNLDAFQLILNPIRDWNNAYWGSWDYLLGFQLILNPIRDWNKEQHQAYVAHHGSN